MAVIGTAQELPDSPRGSGDSQSASFTRSFLVKTDDKNDGPSTVVNAPGIPGYGALYQFGNEFHLTCRLRDKSAERVEEGSYEWIVECEYSTPDKEEDEDEQSDPLLEPPEASISTLKYQLPVEGAYENAGSNNAVLTLGVSNSAGEPFIPAPVRDATRIKLTITANKSINTDVIQLNADYADTVNSDVFWGQPAGKWKCEGITSGSPKLHKVSDDPELYFYYLRLTYIFELRDSWELILLDQGSYYLDGAEKIAFLDQQANPVQGLLDGAGGESNTPVFLPAMKIYKTQAYGALDLPGSFLDCKAEAR